MAIFDVLRIKLPIPSPWKKYYKKSDLDIKIPNISMYDQVRISATKYPNNKAIVYQGKTINYTDLVKKIDKCADAFRVIGVKMGDVVTICLPNIPECLYALYALNKIGAIANMVHPLSAEEEIKQSVNSTNSKIVIFMDMFINKLNEVIDDTCIEKVIVCSATNSLNPLLKFGFYLTRSRKYSSIPRNKIYIKWSKFVKSAKNCTNTNYKRMGRDNPAVILHSGGTSGKPKNVVLQNRTFILGAKQESIALKNLVPGDCCLAIMPNFHGFGLSVCMHTPLSLGCYTILIPEFNAKKFDVLFAKTKPTCVLGVPTLFEALISNNNVKNLDLSFLKYVVSGGDILNSALEKQVNEYLRIHNSKAHITQGYGLSEALAAVTLAHDEINKSGSIGIPLPGNYIKIIDPGTRKSLPFGKSGEIVINSKAFMQGYLNDEVETNEALQIHDDGHIWLHTGDLGYMDKDGFIFYQGRQKRMIITSGYNVYPSHVEEIIEAHPAVLQCTVVGIPHPYKKEVGKAFIVLKEGKRNIFTKNDIRQYCKKNLARYMVPQEFVFRRALPKTKLGKVDFVALKNDQDLDDDE